MYYTRVTVPLLYCTVEQCIVLYCTRVNLPCIVSYCIIHCNSTWYCIAHVEQYLVLYCTRGTVHCIVLYTVPVSCLYCVVNIVSQLHVSASLMAVHIIRFIWKVCCKKVCTACSRANKTVALTNLNKYL
jgi:hypothetical protein